MFEHAAATVPIVTAIALAPGVLRWWWGRSLARLADDPALPERLQEVERRGTMAFVVAVAAITLLSPLAVLWALPLLFVAQLIGVYPLRKVLFDETWSLPAYVWFFVRLLVSVFGFWIVLLMLPAVARAAGRADYLAAAALALALLAWNKWYSEFLRFTLRAEPIDDAALLARFTRLAGACRAGEPGFEQVRLHGGAIANAVALPSVQRPTVLFSETLLVRLEAEESAAICAHELAHLEYYDRDRLRRINLANVGLILIAAAVAPATRLSGLSSMMLPMIAWLGIFLAAMMLRARDRQRNETASDLRAVELTGDAEALVRALTRLYTFARLPRRLDRNHERHATHPSLARRIRDIRNAAGAAVSTIEHASFTAADGRTAVTFQTDRLAWSEGEGLTHGLGYAHLSELRLDARYAGPATLVAVEKGGRRWSMRLAADDVARAQAALDAVDGRLPDHPIAEPVTPGLSRALLALAGLLGLVAGHAAMLFLALIAALQPSSPLLAAAGAGALTAAALMLRDEPMGDASAPVAALTLAVFGTVLLAIAIARRREEMPRRGIVLIVMLAVFTTAAVCFLGFNGFDPIRLHQSTRTVTSATVLLLALGGALACGRVRAMRYASIGVVLTGVGAAAAGSPAFLDRFAADPFIAPSEPIVWATISAKPIAEFPVAFPVAGLRVSDRGALVALEPASYGAVTDLRPFHVGRAGAALAPVTASDLVFPDEGRVLLMDSREGRVELRLLSLDGGPIVTWRHVVPDIFDAALSFQRASGRWRLVGRDGEGRIVRAEGRAGTGTVELTRWPAPATSHGWIGTIATSGGAALAIETRPEPALFRSAALAPWWWLLRPPTMQSHLWTLGRTATTDGAFSRLAVDCADGVLGEADERLVCAAFDGTRTRFVAIDPADGRVTPIAWLRGPFIRHGATGAGWLPGWADRSAVALHLATRQALRFDSTAVVTQVTGTGHTLATTSYRQGDGSIVRIYPADSLSAYTR